MGRTHVLLLMAVLSTSPLLVGSRGHVAFAKVPNSAKVDRESPAPAEPVVFEFVRKCGPAKGRKEAYDAQLQCYFLHVEDIARFRVKHVNPDIQKRQVVLKITGMLEKPEGPLTLYLPQEGGKNKAYSLDHRAFDKQLFLITREAGATTIEFLPKGRQLLKPGAWFQYVDFYRN